MSCELKAIEINGVEYVRKSDAQPEMAKTDGLIYVIVRCRNAGVHAGYLAVKTSEDLTLVKSRRLWRWHGRTISGLAVEGTDDPSQCKFGDPLPELILNANDWCEIIPCTEKARESLEGVAKWQND